MEPVLTTGDQVLVNKIIHGARLFNISAAMKNKHVNIHRSPGILNIQRNEILVFNFPYPNSWDKLELHLLKYYIKRCIGLPGDSLWIRNGKYQINTSSISIGNLKAQEELTLKDSTELESAIFQAFPFDSTFNWNIKNFGPIYIPQKGDRIHLNYRNFKIYKKIIEWEQQETVSFQKGSTYLKNQFMPYYQFQHNYYFMAGDKCENSQDSRYWGLLPEDFIVGKAWIVLKSTDPYTGRFRWERFLKWIH